MRNFHFVILFSTFYLSYAQVSVNSPFEFPEELEEEEEEKSLEKDILVIPNRFPKRLNWFCNPRNEMMRDRFCFGEIDAFALACADDSPPIQLVPFCLGYKHQCSKANYPSEDWCEKEYNHYKRFCTHCEKDPCISFTHDIDCYCEPYNNIWRRYGFETARWCQKYELTCDEKTRRDKGSELVQLMQDRIKVHYRCLHLYNLPHVICDPFSTRFDWYRCMKFLFDCELISDWDDDDYDDAGVITDDKSDKKPPTLPVITKPKSSLPDPSISDQAEILLKGGLSSKQLKENAAIREKEKELESVLKKP
ncbi:unnamed protein product [Caenorhabditis brenneri]